MTACRGITIRSGRQSVFCIYRSFRQLSREIISDEVKSESKPSWTREFSRDLLIGSLCSSTEAELCRYVLLEVEGERYNISGTMGQPEGSERS